MDPELEPRADTALVADSVWAELGSASKATCTAYAGWPFVQPPAPPLLLAADAPLADSVLVELCRVTLLTPSIRRRRSSIRATAGWLVAQPVSVNCGTLPGGVAEVTVAALAPEDSEPDEPLAEEPDEDEPLAEELDELLLEDAALEAGALDAAAPEPALDPAAPAPPAIVPVSDVTET